jgi:hypothetical protein
VLELGGTDRTIFLFQMLALLSIVLIVVVIMMKYYQPSYMETDIRFIFVLYLGVYTFLSFLLTGIYVHPIEQYLYVVNIAAILFILPSLHDTFEVREESSTRWAVTTISSMVIIALLAVIATQSHGELGGSNTRF